MMAEQLPVNMARKFVVQCTKGISYLHHNGVVHGDLHLGNILVYYPGLLSAWTVAQVHAAIEKPRKCHVTRCDGQPIGNSMPEYIVETPRVTELCKFADTPPFICIADYGGSFLTSIRPGILYIDRLHSAPEIIFKEGAASGPSGDI
jgi:serine/threonine protein kinase